MGSVFLFAAWLASLSLMVLPLVGEHYKAPLLLGLIRPLAWVLVVCVSFSLLCLIWAFVTHDFYIIYVAQHSSLQLPLMYRIAAVWGGHEGSLLLWVFLLNLWAMVFLKRYHLTALSLFHGTIGVLGLVNFCLLSLLFFASNPFTASTSLLTGQDLNPLLQDPGMASHPPMLYMGYVGYACVYAHAMAGLFSGKLNADWLKTCRRLSQMAWACLTIGISLGSWWAYRELGWGGYWFWDPVENAALMPWLCGTALIHTLLLAQKTGRYYTLSLSLIILAFSLSLLGTFLVRSGVSISVHSFAHDPMRGSFLLIMFAGIILGSFSLLLFKQSMLEAPFFPLSWLSRPQLLLFSSMLMSVLLGCVMLGTLYPIFLSAFLGEDISVGPPYYEAIFIPIGWLILTLMGLIHWKKKQASKLINLILAVGLTFGILSLYAPLFEMSRTSVGQYLSDFWQASLGLLFCAWMAIQTLQYGWSQLCLQGFKQLNYGVLIGHLGLCIMSFGLVLSTAFGIEEQIIMHTGEKTTLQNYVWTLKETYGVVGPNYRGVGAEVRVQKEGSDKLIKLYPEKRIYTVSQQVMTDADIHSGFFRDLFVSLGEPQDEETWSLRISIKPFIRWIWIGALIIALGGLMAACAQRKNHE